MAALQYTHFPSDLSRSFKETFDGRFWGIFLIVFLIVNSIFYYRAIINPIEVSFEDKQAFIRKLYRVDKSVIEEIEARRIAQAQAEAAQAEREEVIEERAERQGLSDEERAARRAEARATREAQQAQRRLQAAKRFMAAGVASGGGGIGSGGGGDGEGGGSGGRKFGIAGSGGRGIATGGMSSIGGGPRFVEGQRYVEAGGGIEVSESATGTANMTGGQLQGGLVLEEIEEPTGEGAQAAARQADQLRPVVEENMPGVQRCFERFRKRDPELNGRINIKFTVMADGSVQRVTINGRWSNPSIGAEVEGCIRNLIQRRWRFPAIAKGETVVEFPITFK